MSTCDWCSRPYQGGGLVVSKYKHKGDAAKAGVRPRYGYDYKVLCSQKCAYDYCDQHGLSRSFIQNSFYWYEGYKDDPDYKNDPEVKAAQKKKDEEAKKETKGALIFWGIVIVIGFVIFTVAGCMGLL